MNEKRRHIRVFPEPINPVEIHIMGDGFIDIFKVTDISNGGARIFVPHHFEGCNINSKIKVLIKLPKIKSFTANAVIKHKLENNYNNDYYGIEFLYLSDEQTVILDNYVKTRTKQGAVI